MATLHRLLETESSFLEKQLVRSLEYKDRGAHGPDVDIISPGCAISPLSPSGNIKAMAEAIHTWFER